MESFANKNNGLYPSRTAVDGKQASTVLCGDLGITTCPEDPKYTDGSDGYEYKYRSDGTSNGNATATEYVLWAKLEKTGGYWVVCSSGLSGSSASEPSDGGACPF